MSNSSFQSEIPKARINLKLDLHTGGASKKTELPLKLLVAGDFSNGQESAPLSERKKVNLNKNNFDSVLSEYSPIVNITVKNTLAGDGSEDNINLTFLSINDFSPEQVSRQIAGMFMSPDQVNNTWRVVLSRDDLDPDKARVIEAGNNRLTLQALKDE
ncbi:type VI secretion system contractile sheath small subunit [Enterobacter ludwigii]|uniref:type VI secretion system contractile sheath small subunit n=1 Tax=Enterobacter ludwigii TaxID=299767 RepID=UPI0022E86F42|nr:type VI secretion system contractile sheath small subunit [Enterobacter ludwigii]